MQIIFNRKKLEKHRNLAANYLPNYDFLLQLATNDIFARLEIIDPLYEKKTILDLGARNGTSTKKLKQLYPAAKLVASDISFNMLNNNLHDVKVQLDEELLPFQKNSFDLIISCLNLHWINDVPGFLAQVKNILHEDGILIINFFGGATLQKLKKSLIDLEFSINKAMSQRVSLFINLETATNLMKRAGFNNFVTDSQIIEVEYSSLYNITKDLSRMGEGSCFFPHHFLSKKTLSLMKKEEDFNDSFEIITIATVPNQYQDKAKLY